MSKYKFRRLDDEKINGDAQSSHGGVMTECNPDTPNEHVLSAEDAVSFIFLFWRIDFYSIHQGQSISALFLDSIHNMWVSDSL